MLPRQNKDSLTNTLFYLILLLIMLKLKYKRVDVIDGFPNRINHCYII